MDPSLKLRYGLAYQFRVIHFDDAQELVGRHALSRLVSRGLIDTRVVLARPMLDLRAPLRGTPGEMSYQAQSRGWEAARPTRVCFLSVKEARRWSVSPKRFDRNKPTHDLHVARVVRAHPEKDSILGEDAVRPLFRRGDKIPDLVVMGPDATITRYADFAGCYGAQKIRALIESGQQKGVTCEIW